MSGLIYLDPSIYPVHATVDGKVCIGPCGEPGTIVYNPVSGRSKAAGAGYVCPTSDGKFSKCFGGMQYVGVPAASVGYPSAKNIAKYVLSSVHRISSYKEYKRRMKTEHFDSTTKAQLKRCAKLVFGKA